ncbi:MAG TPA: CoA transferase, partial [Pseudomonadales bacterium]
MAANATESSLARAALAGLLRGMGGDDAHIEAHIEAGPLMLNTRFAVADAAAAALAATGVAAARIHGLRTGTTPRVVVNRRRAEASLLSFALQRFTDATRAPAQFQAVENRTAVAGFYPARDGRIVYLHAGFPHNTRGLLKLLGVADDRAAVAAAVARRDGTELEDAIAHAGLCGAMVRDAHEWDTSRAGIALAARDVVDIVQVGDSEPIPFPRAAEQPLRGVRVLDLTRVLAGPTCARTLAMYGADALRVGAQHLPTIELFDVDTGLGKRAAFIDLKTGAGRDALRALVSDADVFSQGYRSGAMERLGFGVADVVRQRPGIV